MPRQIKKHPECIYGNQCVLFCVNPNCKKPGFICQKGINNRGQCGLFHQNCQKMAWNQLDSIIYDNPNTKTAQFQQFVEEMQTLFSIMIKKIKEQHLKFKIFIRTFAYSNEMMKFIKQVNDQDFDRITGQKLNHIISQLLIKDQKRINREFIFDRSKFISISSQIDQCFDKLSTIYKRSSSSTSSQLRRSASLTKAIVVPPIDTFDSKITKDFEFIRSLFEQTNKPVKKLKNIYRASESEYSASEFHRKCDNIQHTLLLVETEFGRIIGGYTPLTWDSSKKHWTTDKQLSSFIFSLTMREKFSLNLSQFAIACNQQKGPIFGCCDICIVDRSDRQQCNAEFPISYSNFKHPRSAQTNVEFIGSENGRFRTKEWEVFQVEFYQQ